MDVVNVHVHVLIQSWTAVALSHHQGRTNDIHVHLDMKFTNSENNKDIIFPS